MSNERAGKNSYSIYLIIGIFFLLNPLISTSQKKAKFGKVSIKELEMTVYEHDTSAVAVVLYDHGEYLNQTFRYTRHRRIKVLKSAGTSYGNMSIGVPYKSTIRGVVHNLENGKVVTHKLEKESIHKEEQFEDEFYYKLFFPNVKVGSIIDVQYSFYGIPYEWRFQDLIPTIYSEIKLEESTYVNFGFEQRGFEPITQLGERHWKATHIPAFKKEPFTTHYANYTSKLEFRINYSWESIAQDLMLNDRFGDVIKQSAFLNSKAKELKAMNLSKKQLIDSAYTYIRNSISWNGRNGVIVSNNYKQAHEKLHSGSVSDINLALLALLKELGVQAFPVLLNTRDRGMVIPYNPNVWKLNYVMAMVMDETGDVLLDATMKKGKVGMIPERCINGFGYAITGAQSGRLVELTPKVISNERQFVEIRIDEFGDHTAKVSTARSNYHYLNWVEAYETHTSEEDYAKFLEKEYSALYDRDFEIVAYSNTKNDPVALSCSETTQISLSDLVDDLGNELILNPNLFSSLRDNPFKSENRNCPVDMSFLRKHSSSISIFIPKGYHVTSVPDPISLKLSDGSASFSYSANQVEGKIQILYRLGFTKTVYSEEEYLELRQLYHLINDKLNESLQINKGT